MIHEIRHHGVLQSSILAISDSYQVLVENLWFFDQAVGTKISYIQTVGTKIWRIQTLCSEEIQFELLSHKNGCLGEARKNPFRPWEQKTIRIVVNGAIEY